MHLFSLFFMNFPLQQSQKIYFHLWLNSLIIHTQDWPLNTQVHLHILSYLRYQFGPAAFHLLDFLVSFFIFPSKLQGIWLSHHVILSVCTHSAKNSQSWCVDWSGSSNSTNILVNSCRKIPPPIMHPLDIRIHIVLCRSILITGLAMPHKGLLDYTSTGALLLPLVGKVISGTINHEGSLLGREWLYSLKKTSQKTLHTTEIQSLIR